MMSKPLFLVYLQVMDKKMESMLIEWAETYNDPRYFHL